MNEPNRKADPAAEILETLRDYDPMAQNEILSVVKKELLKVREGLIKETESRKNYLIDSLAGL